MGKIGIAIIGCGNRSACVVEHLLKDSKGEVEIITVFDPSKESRDATLPRWSVNEQTVKVCESYQEAIDNPDVKWVMIFSPNAFHKEHILYAFEAKKHVFTEKPLATSIDDCQTVFEAHKKSNSIFATGFVLRYAPLYRKIKSILEAGKVGKILSIEANENIAPCHGGYIMANWRRHTALAGPHILEKCCHDLDLINWFCQSLPSKVNAFASREFFKEDNKFLVDKYGKETFDLWWNPNRDIDTPFNEDNDLMDTFTGIAQYRNGIYVSFNATMSNAIPERRMRFNCSEGTIIGELYTGMLQYKNLKDEHVSVIAVAGDGHGGGDDYIMKELFETMKTGVAPKCSGNEGLESAVFALALDNSVKAQNIVDLEPVWQKLNR